MSGHSKWSTIKRKKGALDAQRGKIFSDLSKAIRVAVREGGSGDPAQNPSLRLAVDKAKAANMPSENVKRAIDRGMGIGKGGSLEEVVYEGYGPHGVGFIVVAITDNKMRTASEIRSIFSKHQGSLGGPGSVMFMFKKENNEYSVTIPFPIQDPQHRTEIEEFEEILQEHDDIEEVYHTAVFE
jgi:YebC/PmpR family DNA-binding regulatory protein